jgi:hypothetical protein
MDFENHFTSKFTNLYWTGFEKFINNEDPSPECYMTRAENASHLFIFQILLAGSSGQQFDGPASKKAKIR